MKKIEFKKRKTAKKREYINIEVFLKGEIYMKRKKKEPKTKYRKSIEEMTLADKPLFLAAMKDKECLEYFLRAITNEKTLEVKCSEIFKDCDGINLTLFAETNLGDFDIELIENESELPLEKQNQICRSLEKQAKLKINEKENVSNPCLIILVKESIYKLKQSILEIRREGHRLDTDIIIVNLSNSTGDRCVIKVNSKDMTYN